MGDRYMHPPPNGPLQGHGAPPPPSKPHPGYVPSYWQHEHRGSIPENGTRHPQHMPHPSGPGTGAPGSYPPSMHHTSAPYPPQDPSRSHLPPIQNQPTPSSRHSHPVYNSPHHPYSTYSHHTPPPPPQPLQRTTGTPPMSIPSHAHPAYDHPRQDTHITPHHPHSHVQHYHHPHMQSQPVRHMPPPMEPHRAQHHPPPPQRQSHPVIQPPQQIHYSSSPSQMPMSYGSEPPPMKHAPPMGHPVPSTSIASGQHHQSQSTQQSSLPLQKPSPVRASVPVSTSPPMVKSSEPIVPSQPRASLSTSVASSNQEPFPASVLGNANNPTLPPAGASTSTTAPIPSNPTIANGAALAVAPPPRKASNKAKQRIQEQTANVALEASPVSIPPSQPNIPHSNSVGGRATPDVEDVDEESNVHVAAAELKQKQKRHKDLLDRLDKMDKEFTQNKERIFEEKIKQYDLELEQILQGNHPDFLDVLAELESERDAMVKEAELFRDYQLECANRLYRLEYEACIAEYNAEKSGLRDKMLQELEDKKRKYREERDSFDLNNDAVLDTQKPTGTRKTTRNSQPKQEERRDRKKKTGNAAVLPFMLKEAEIAEDFAIFRKHSNAIRNKPSIALGKPSRR